MSPGTDAGIGELQFATPGPLAATTDHVVSASGATDDAADDDAVVDVDGLPRLIRS
jgi:hypothetical protein